MGMLILTRQVGEAVVLTDTTTGEVLGEVKLLGLTPTEARIGFNCPRHIEVLRDDVRSKTPKERTV